MTDDVRLPDPLGAARALPRGSLVIVRAIDRGARTQLATRMMALSRTRDLIVLIAADAALASTVEADGLHLPEAHMRDALHWRALRPRWLVTVAAHSLCGLMRAHAAGADAAILSPVFATASHPQAPTLGPLRLRALARQSPVPVYALGGVDAMSAPGWWVPRWRAWLRSRALRRRQDETFETLVTHSADLSSRRLFRRCAAPLGPV